MEQEQQTIWKLYLIIGLITLNIISCNKNRHLESFQEVSYVYKNESGIDLVIEVYDNTNTIFKSFIINNGNNVQVNETNGITYSFFVFNRYTENVKYGESVKIKFSDNKCLEYYRENDDDLFDVTEYDNYTTELTHQNSYTLYYTFTQEHYNLSDDCN